MSLLPDRPGRPRIVTFLGYFLLGIAGALVVTAVRFAIPVVKAASRPDVDWRPLGLVVLMTVLLAVWIGTAGCGLLLGRAWSRALVAAMALLAAMLFIGLMSKPEKQPVQIGVTLGAMLLTGAAAAYLFSTRTDGWFHPKDRLG